MLLEKLSPEQEKVLTQKREEWLHHGLSTSPANREEAERGVREAYRSAGLEEPKIFIWLGSPMAGAIAGAAVCQRAQVGDQVRVQVRDQAGDQAWDLVRDQAGDQAWDLVRDLVRDPVGDQAWAQVGGQVRVQVRDQAGNQAWDLFRDQVGDQAWDLVRDLVRDPVGVQVRVQVRDQAWVQVRDQVRDQVGDLVGDQAWVQLGDLVGHAVYGQHEAAWLAFYDVFSSFGLDAPGLNGLTRVAQAAGWWWPFEHAVILTERPALMKRDPQGRLHCEDGMAIQYPDGWGFYSWHGTPVPEDLIMGNWSPKDALQEENAEVRRAAIEKIGWDNFTQHLKLVAESDDPGNPGQRIRLYDFTKKLNNPYPAPARLLLCTNGTVERDGTRRQFGLPVPNSHKDPIAAVAELYGCSTETYKQLQRRT